MNITKKNILIVFPHPDDESVFTAGLIQKALNLGSKVTYICLTQGEASTLRYGLNETDSLKEARIKEMNNVATYLNFDLIFGKFSDGGLTTRRDEVKEYLAREIASLKPDMIITFEPDGVYGHPDHITNSAVLTEIYKESKDSFQLVYATVDKNFKVNKGAQKMAKDYSRITPIRPNLIIRLNPIQAYKKFKALQLHKTQMGKRSNLLTELRFSKFLFSEHFYVVGN